MSEEVELAVAAADHDSFVSIAPGVGILGVFAHLNYEPWYALGEFVDNALESSIRFRQDLRALADDYQLRVDIAYERENGGRIVIEDNAAGIPLSEFDRAFRAAEVPPDRTGLSEFGMGMKSASIWFARNWRVVTTSLGDPHVYAVEFDMATVLRDNVERLSVSKSTAPADAHFTRIELWNLNQFLPARTLGKVRDHLREIYRAFLREDQLALSVAGQVMQYREPAVLDAPDYRAVEVFGGESAPSLVWRKQVAFQLEDGVTVSGWAAIRERGNTKGNGLSLFRRGRLILGTADSPYRPASIYGSTNTYKSQRVFGELDVEGLPVSHTKDGFQWKGLEDSFESRLREVLDAEPLPLLKQAEGYRVRASKPTHKVSGPAVWRPAEPRAHSTAQPAPLGVVLGESAPPAVARTSERVPPTTGARVREVAFEHQDDVWTVTLTAAPRPAQPNWLVDHVDMDSRAGGIEASVLINTAHPLFAGFDLEDADRMDVVYRLALAMVVSKSKLKASGDGETAALFMRHVEALLVDGLLVERGTDR